MEDEYELQALYGQRLIVTPVFIENIVLYQENPYHKGAIHIDIHNK